ncbi:hypothetical protein FQA39_LY11684 [Lamprigera yunnana]|nr:hypothetical protein FQA39_LY11684 [Lamprigera yunnana]
MLFTSEQDRFIVMAHFRSGTLNPDGNWSYSLQSCIERFMQQYPDEKIECDILNSTNAEEDADSLIVTTTIEKSSDTKEVCNDLKILYARKEILNDCKEMETTWSQVKQIAPNKNAWKALVEGIGTNANAEEVED